MAKLLRGPYFSLQRFRWGLRPHFFCIAQYIKGYASFFGSQGKPFGTYLVY